MKYSVLVPNILNHPFTYESEKKLNIGDYVKVPFGKSVITGLIWDEFENSKNKNFKIKKILKRIEIEPLKIETIKFLRWFSDYNMVPLGMSLKLHLLSGDAVINFNNSEYKIYNKKEEKKIFKLTNEQNKILKEVQKELNKFRVHLLQGTTGSGKTIIYFKTIEKVIKDGNQALILLPEIGLTGQFEKKFKEFFGFNPAIWHSGITPKRKKIIWSGLASKKINVIIGARSSLFLPFKKLGIIIVDEEHDQSYKQDEGVIYNARDMAIARANFENVPINLVTAVPSLETYANVKNNKYSLSRLIDRYKKANLPTHKIIDLNKHKLIKESFISSEIIRKAKYHIDIGDQVLFFVNRRGFAPYVLCKKCFKTLSCPHCSINLVYHKNVKKLLCHYCGFKTSSKRKCFKQEECDFIYGGLGVEKVFDQLKLLFPNQKITIFSSDTINKVSSKNTLEKILSGDINIIVGTQLISKGYHFPKLNCIVVLEIDLNSQGHDLRSAEKNLQLYHQLSGRAGRDGKPAVVYFQSYDLKSESINQITSEDPFIFLERELKLRKNNNLPPFERFISLILTSTNENRLEIESNKLKKYLENKIQARVLGPVEAQIYRIKRKYRQRILIRSKKTQKIQKVLRLALNQYKIPSEIKLTVDVDPISFN